MDQEAIALVGVALGAIAGLSGTWLSVQHQRHSERRSELRELIAGFWASTDLAWRSAQGLEHAVLALGDARDNPEVFSIYEERRKDALRRLHEAEVQAGRHLALLRILHPVMALPATVLLARSLNYDHANRVAQRASRQEAVTDFETLARQVIAGVPWWKRSWRAVRWFRHIRKAQSEARTLAEHLNRPQ